MRRLQSLHEYVRLLIRITPSLTASQMNLGSKLRTFLGGQRHWPGRMEPWMSDTGHPLQRSGFRSAWIEFVRMKPAQNCIHVEGRSQGCSGSKKPSNRDAHCVEGLLEVACKQVLCTHKHKVFDGVWVLSCLTAYGQCTFVSARTVAHANCHLVYMTTDSVYAEQKASEHKLPADERSPRRVTAGRFTKQFGD